MKNQQPQQPASGQPSALRSLAQRRWVRLLYNTGYGFVDDNCGQMAAALAYFALLSIFPLLLLLVSQLPGLLALLRVDYNVRLALLGLVGSSVSPQVADWLSQGLLGLEESQGTAGIIGLLTLLWSSSVVFGQIDLAFNRIWRVYDDVGRRTGFLSVALGWVRGRLLSFLLMMLVGLLLLLNSVFTGALLVIQQLFPALPFSGLVGTAMGWLVSLALSMLGLGLLYRFLPHTHVLWRDVWLGSLLAALLNELAKSLVARFITSGTGGFYQSIAGPLALMIWVYFTSQIVFAGCELNRHYALIYGSRSTASGVAQAAAVEREKQADAIAGL